MFNGTRMSSKSLANLIIARINKWGSSSKIISFGNDTLWHVNPQGAIALYFYRVNKDYWKFKSDNFDLVCAVDGAWGCNTSKVLVGAIGGKIWKGNSVILHSFSTQINAQTSKQAEVDGIIYVIRLFLDNRIACRNLVICSDSVEAIGQVNSGLKAYYLIEGPLNLAHLINSSIFVHYGLKELNLDADSFAKAGLDRPRGSFFWAENSNSGTNG